MNSITLLYNDWPFTRVLTFWVAIVQCQDISYIEKAKRGFCLNKSSFFPFQSDCSLKKLVTIDLLSAALFIWNRTL